jgi:sortase A
MRDAVSAKLMLAQEEDRAARELLNELISTPPPIEAAPLRAAVVRSTDEQRELAFAPFLLRTWLDRALQQVEWLLVLATVAFFAYWLIDGYGRDWWHAQQAQQVASAPSAFSSAGEAARAAPQDAGAPAMLRSAALPYTTPAMERAPELDDVFVPGQRVVPLEQPRDPRPNRLLIPAIAVDTPVVEVGVVDGAWQVADYAAGFHQGSALPGDTGNTVMAGHAGLRGAVFKDLGRLAPGDPISVETGGWRYSYRVREITSVLPTQVEVMAPTTTPVLTLITCTAWDTQRLIVVADLVDARPLSSGQ